MSSRKIVFGFLLTFWTFLNAAAQPELTRDSVMKITKRVAVSRASIGGYDWIYGTFCTGYMAIYATTGERSYLDKLVNWGKGIAWKPGDGNPYTTNADNQCCCQTYCEAYLAEPIPANVNRYGIWKADWDSIAVKGNPRGRTLWSWEDALFMAPAAVSMLGKITGDTRYYDTLSAYWWDVADLLYDSTYHLYYRDAGSKGSRYNNLPVFWGRGCGWVAAGYARVLAYMPENYAGRAKHEKQFRDFCGAIFKCQGSDGLWRTDLLSPSRYPAPEMSSTAFYCFAFAWGVNNGLLDRDTFALAAKKAWSGMVRYVTASGSLTNVQAEGTGPAAPGNGTTPYAEGGFMLAGCEMYKLLKPVEARRGIDETKIIPGARKGTLRFDCHGAPKLFAAGALSKNDCYGLTGKKLGRKVSSR
jgi:unsaturated rhamnogalacturonyl hydrolase